MFWGLSALVVSCGGKEGVKTLFQPRTPHQAYAHNLETANLHQTALGRNWLAAGQQALLDSNVISLPYQETGYFKADKPAAASFSFKARRGELLDIKVVSRTRQQLRLFLDLFETNGAFPRATQHLAAADTTNLHLEHLVTADAFLLVRLQPELLQSGSYTITLTTKPSLGFPVLGKNTNAVQSFWGAERDGGARRHEGVDIFAARGTPAVASTHGIISRVTETPIGGKVVWLADGPNQQQLYYAHLDKQLVQPGQRVAPGDTLGLVGNTGNAKGTPPHLHFGIYQYGSGAVDPFPFIANLNKKPGPLQVNENQIGEWGRVSKPVANLRQSPASQSPVVSKLPRHTVFQVIGGTTAWYRIQLPNGQRGYLHKDMLENLQQPLRTQHLPAAVEITELPLPASVPIARPEKGSKIAVLGFYQLSQFVKLADGTLGWLQKT